MPLDEARQILERAAALCRAKGDVAAAQSLIELYSKLRRRAKTTNCRPNRPTPPPKRSSIAKNYAGAEAGTVGEQCGQFLIAARAYDRAASKVAPGPDQAQWLWRAADRYLKARQQQAALDVLTKMTQLEGVLAGENIADAWFQLASIHHQKQHYAAARAAYQRCLKLPGKFSFQSRYQIAMLDMLENKFDEAETGLQENRTALRAATPPDPALLEQTEYSLGFVAFQRQSAIKEESATYSSGRAASTGAHSNSFPKAPTQRRPVSTSGGPTGMSPFRRAKPWAPVRSPTTNAKRTSSSRARRSRKLPNSSRRSSNRCLTVRRSSRCRPTKPAALALSFSVAQCYFYSASSTNRFAVTACWRCGTRARSANSAP